MFDKITSCLWFDRQAEDAARFYVSVFPNSKITDIAYYSDAGPMPKGTVLIVSFELDGQPFTALNGGPQFKFTEAVSFQIPCKDQKDVDYYWDKLTAGGSESQCGWLKDKYGLSWQVVPVKLIELAVHGEPAKLKRMNEAMFKMKKLDIAALEQAYNG
ncbi:MAG TPA: VOC family protein [Rhizomicrobium sp.]|nr:VOC family protein [Rhizomicrobium sp.]